MWEDLVGPEYGPKALKKLKSDRTEQLFQERLEKVTATLRKHFPEISERTAKFTARALLEEPSKSGDLYHRGAIDRRAIQKIRRALLEAHSGIDELSPWSLQSLNSKLNELGTSDFAREPSEAFPNDVEALRAMIRGLLGITVTLERALHDGSPHNGKNWPAITVIEAARKIWYSRTGRHAPKRYLNEETRFAQFLRDLFDDLSIGANLLAAFRAWAGENKDPTSHLFGSD